MILTWDPDLIVGIHEVDAQHKQMMTLTNQLCEAILAGKCDSEAGAVLDRLIAETGAHFDYELSLMEQTADPNLEQHKAEHLDLIRQVNDFRDHFCKKQLGLSTQLIEFLKHWLTHHILTEDQKLGQHLRAQGYQ